MTARPSLTTAQQALERAQQALAVKQQRRGQDVKAGPVREVTNTRTVDTTGLGQHHPDVARWAPLVQFLFSQVGFGEETNYALMVMWGESGGKHNAVGPQLRTRDGRQVEAHGLFQHMSQYWPERQRAAASFWRARGVTIGTDWDDPLTNIAVAAWLRAVGGWKHWAVTYDWYKEGTWGDGTFWDGYQYRNMELPSNTLPPRGDGQVAGQPGRVGAASGGGRFIHPLPGFDPTGHYGDPRSNGTRTHEGADFGAPEGSLIRATDSGRVVSIGQGTEAAGLQVTIDHGNGWTSFYCHLRPGSFKVRQGQVVGAGDIIAEVGQTGNANGPHLHFEINNQGKPIDPEKLGVTQHLNPTDRSLAGLTGATQQPVSKRDRLRAALFGSLDVISRSVAGGERAPVPGSAPAWAGPSPADEEQGNPEDALPPAPEGGF